MKTIRLKISVLTLMVLYQSSSSTGIDGFKTQLKESHIQLHSLQFQLFLLVHTKEPIDNPDELVKAFSCSSIGEKLIIGQNGSLNSLPLSLSPAKTLMTPTAAPIPKGQITWDVANPIPNTYMFQVESDQSGYAKCKDRLGIGLESKEVLYTSGLRTNVLARYGLRSISSVKEALRKESTIPTLMFVDPDTPTDPEVTIRYQSFSPNLEQNLTENALELARKANWSVKYVRGCTFCPSEEKEGFKWPATKVGRRATPIVPCIDEKGTLTPSRRCLGSALEGAYWEPLDPREKCIKKSRPEPALLAVIQKQTEETLKNMDLALKETVKPLGAVEVNLATLALSAALRSRESVSLSCVAAVLDKILETGKWNLKSATDSSSSSEAILDAIDQIIPRSDSNSSISISRKRISAVSFHVGATSPGFALIDEKSMIVLERDEPVDVIFKLRPKVAAYRVKASEGHRMDYIVMEDDSLFMHLNLRRRAVGPVVGVGITDNPQLNEILTVLIGFKRDAQDPRELRCATWDPKTDEDWSISTLSCSKGKTSVKFESLHMDFCLCNFIANGFTFVTRIYAVKDFDFYKHYASNVLKPRLELLYKEKTSDVVLIVYNRNALDFEGPILSTLECSVNASHMDEYPLGLNPRKPIVLYNYTTTTTFDYLKNMAIVNVSYGGYGNMTCRDRLGLGLVSNQIVIHINNAAVVRCRTGTLENLDDFMADYAFKYSEKFKMVVRIQYQSSNGKEFVLRFSQSFQKNHTDFIRNVTLLSVILAQDYGWGVEHARSTKYCLSIEEGGFEWPTTQLGHSAVPLSPCVDFSGMPSPTRRCLGNHIDGSYWESEPKRPDPCSKPSDRTVLLRKITDQKNKMDAIEQVSEAIEVGPSLNPYEISILSTLLNDAADEVSYTDSKLQNISSFATIVNSMQEAGRDVLRMADAATGSSHLVRESIDVLLATASSSTPTVVSKPHFSALAASLDSGVRGFVQDKSVPIGKSMITLRGNTTIDEVMRMSPKVAAYFRTLDLQKGVITSTLFHDDSLFGAPSRGRRVISPVVGMALLSKKKNFLEYDQPLELLILFRREEGDPLRRNCQFWDPNEEGGWSGVGCELLPEGYIPGISGMDVCACTHITYFALLIIPEPFLLNDEDEETMDERERNLHIVSIVGCSVSLFCTLMVFVAAAISSEYRRGDRRKVHLNITASQALLMGSYIAISSYGRPPDTEEIKSCLAMGVILHYSLLASFIWTFMAALFLYLKFNPELRKKAKKIVGTHYVLRAALITWGAPGIFVVGVLLAGTDQYSRRPRTALCYPEGAALYASVIFPVSLICLANFVVFLKLLRFIFFLGDRSNETPIEEDDPKPTFQFFSVVSYFSLLGLFWGLGLAMNLTTGKALIPLAYSFCATAALPGFTVFIVFVICDRGRNNDEGIELPNKDDTNTQQSPSGDIPGDQHEADVLMKDDNEETQNNDDHRVRVHMLTRVTTRQTHISW